MDIDCLLINPYFLKFDPTQKKQRSPYEPLGLLYLGKVLKQSGYNVRLLDCTFLNSIEEAKEEIKALMPKTVGISSKITLTKYVIEFINYSKKLGIPTIVGGPDASLRPIKYINLGADYVVVGEGEETTKELLFKIINNEEVSNVKGIVYKKNGQLISTPPRPFIRNLDSLGSPDRSLIDIYEYRDVWLEDHGFAMATVMTSRGCPYACNYCSNPIAPFGRRYTYRSAKNVVDELEELIVKYGFDRIWFADDVFTINRERTIALCKEILNRGLKFKWSCLTRADRVDEEMLKLMKKAGCEQIFYGLESGAQEMLDAMNRNMKVETMRKGLLTTKKVGIRIHTFVVVGYPGERYEYLLKTLDFMKEILPDEYSFTIAYPLPGTKLYNLVDFKEDPELEWESPNENKFLFKSDMPQQALRFFIEKTRIELALRRRFKKLSLVERIFNKTTNLILRFLTIRSGKYDWKTRERIISKYLKYEQKMRFR
jgi:anaerobic magnesium-protoporphyrin IX monomethyl ester cyclase